MPLGNLTSQFFANVFLNELDYFIKYELNIKYYVRYVDDFIILHSSKKQLQKWKVQISKFLQAELKIELHPQKSKLIPLSRGIDFVGFRNFCYYRLVRKRNVRKMKFKINQFEKGCHNYKEMTAIFQGFNAHAKWANTYKIRKDIASQIYKIKHKTLKTS